MQVNMALINQQKQWENKQTMSKWTNELQITKPMSKPPSTKQANKQTNEKWRNEGKKWIKINNIDGKLNLRQLSVTHLKQILPKQNAKVSDSKHIL